MNNLVVEVASKNLMKFKAFEIIKQLTCEVYAFVEATPISGPALM